MPENQNPFNNNEFPKQNEPTLDLPKENESQNNINQVAQETTQPKPLIEIPQEYYDKLEKEKQQRQEEQIKATNLEAEKKEAVNATGKLLFFATLNAILIYGLIYVTLNISKIAIVVVPAIAVILTIFNAIKDRENSQYPVSVMVGGILVAVITFIISMTNEDKADLWTYYAVVSAVLGLIGLISTSIINKMCYDLKNIKALQTLGYILYFVVLIGAPLYCSKKYPEAFHKLIFKEQVEVVAETQSEFIIKTLKARYNIDFTCDDSKVKNYLDEKKRKITKRVCKDKSNTEVNVTSLAYNEGSNQYVVQDDYIDTIILKPVKTRLNDNIKKVTGANNVDTALYPESNCFFYGDCVDCDEYYERYDKENNLENQFRESTKLNFEKIIQKEAIEFVNENKIKYFIDVYGSYSTDPTLNSTVVENVLKQLNQSGFKNNYGYIINIYNVSGKGDDSLTELVYKVVGDTNSEKTFKDPMVQNTNGNKTTN